MRGYNHEFRKKARNFLFAEFRCSDLKAARRGVRVLSSVIPVRAQREPRIHFAARSAVRWIPGSPFVRPGMTTEGEALTAVHVANMSAKKNGGPRPPFKSRPRKGAWCSGGSELDALDAADDEEIG
jgi:hypothetical protein